MLKGENLLPTYFYQLLYSWAKYGIFSFTFVRDIIYMYVLFLEDETER